MTRKLIITDDLRKVLLQIKNNYISSYLLLEDIDDNILNHPEKEFNYIDLSHTTKGHLSYLTKEKIDKIEASENKDFWEVKVRYHSRPGSLVKKMFKVPDYQIESFTTQLLSIVDPPIYSMKVIKGEDIAKYYSHAEHAQPYGSLGSSCMKMSPREYFDIYVHNPNQINMLVMFDHHDKVMGRAILWNGNGFKLMDRIYICNDTYLTYFYNWAIENNCYYKEFNTWNTPKHLMFNNEKVIKEFEITLDKTQFNHYPYLDTFKWLDRMDKKIYNYIPAKYKDEKYLDEKYLPEYDGDMVVISDHQGGSFEHDYFKFCDMTHYCNLKSDIMHLDYLGMDVYTGETIHSHTLNKYIYREHAVINNDIRDYVFIPEYDKFNDASLIEAKKKELEEKRKKGEMMKAGLFRKSESGKEDVENEPSVVRAPYNPYTLDWLYNPYNPYNAMEPIDIGRGVRQVVEEVIESQPNGLYENGNFLSVDIGEDFFDVPREDEKLTMTIECDTWVEDDKKEEKITEEVLDKWYDEWVEKSTGYIN